MPWRMLPLMMVFVALAHFNRLSMTVAGAEQIIRYDLLSKEQMGVIYAGLLIVYTLCMVPGGWFLDRFGPRAAWMVVVFGSAAFVTATGAVGAYLADSSLFFVALLAVRACLGVVCAPLHPTAARLVANWVHPSATNLANGLINAAALLGIALTYFVFGTLIDFFGWPEAFMVAGGFTFAFALVWFWLGADRPPRQETIPEHADLASVQAGEPPVFPVSRTQPNDDGSLRSPHGFGRIVTDVRLVALTLSYGLLGYFQYLFFYWAQYYFETQMNLPVQESRGACTLLTLAMAGGMFTGGWLSDRTRRRYPGRWGLAAVPMLALAVAGTATWATLGERPAWGVLAGLAVAMAAAGLSEGAYWTTAVRLGREYGGTAAAIMNTAANAIGLLAPLLTPWISDEFGWQASLGLAAIVCWVAAIAWLGVGRS